MTSFSDQSGGAVLSAGVPPPEGTTVLNYHPAMEYRRLGSTGLYISAISLGGHWKGIGAALGRSFTGTGFFKEDFENLQAEDFRQNRHELLSRAIDLGVNYVDACAGPEILAYADALRGRRERMYLGYSWHTLESRFAEYRTAAALLAGLEEGMRAAKLDYVDLWRISLPLDGVDDPSELRRVEEGAVEALLRARRDGKVCFTGVSSHHREWLTRLVRLYGEAVQVVLFPFPAGSRPAKRKSLLEAIRETGAGAIAIKPFAGGALFEDDGVDNDQLARLAIRSILRHPDLHATTLACASAKQAENAAAAVAEGWQLSEGEEALLSEACGRMWRRLPPHQQFLTGWREV